MVFMIFEFFSVAKNRVSDQNTVMKATFGYFWFSNTRYFFFTRGGGAGGNAGSPLRRCGVVGAGWQF